jgi:hypothetical protein
MKEDCNEALGLVGAAATEGAGVVDTPVGNIGEGEEVARVALFCSAPCSARKAGAPVVKDENGVCEDEGSADDCCCGD